MEGALPGVVGVVAAGGGRDGDGGGFVGGRVGGFTPLKHIALHLRRFHRFLSFNFILPQILRADVGFFWSGSG